MGEFAQGTRLPGVDLEMGRERWWWGRARSYGVRTTRGASTRGLRWNAEVGKRMEGVDAVEEFQVEGRGGLAVDLRFGRVGHDECVVVSILLL